MRRISFALFCILGSTSAFAAGATNPMLSDKPNSIKIAADGRIEQANKPVMTTSVVQKDPIIGKVPSKKTKDKQFKQAVDSHWPMSNAEIRKFRKIVTEHSRAITDRGWKVERSSRTEKMSGTFKTVYVTAGYITTINFSDYMGNPWPIDYIISSNDTEIMTGKADKYTVIATGVGFAGDVNMVVKLKDKKLPIHLTLSINNKSIDYMFVGKVSGVSPDAIIDTVIPDEPTPGIKVNVALMNAFLGETAPGGATKLNVDREGIEAWLYKKKMYIRAPYILASPATAENGVASDGAGMYIYRLNKLFRKPVFLINGRYFFVNISNGGASHG